MTEQDPISKINKNKFFKNKKKRKENGFRLSAVGHPGTSGDQDRKIAWGQEFETSLANMTRQKNNKKKNFMTSAVQY